jgi:hypothetical protein
MTDTDTDTTDLTATVDTWLEAYAEPDADRRAALVAEVWTADGHLADPPFEGRGHEAIAALGGVVLEHYAGHTFRRTTAVDAHHGTARYEWELVAPDGTVAVAGTDVATFTDDGRLQKVIGFFGPLRTCGEATRTSLVRSKSTPGAGSPPAPLRRLT